MHRFGWMIIGLAACGEDPDKEPIALDDTAPDSDADSDADTDTDADTDADSDADTDAFDGVIVRYTDRYIGPDGSVTPQDRDPFAGAGLIQIRIYAADGTSTLYPASLASPGELRFSGVPEQTYILEVYGQPDMALNLPGRQDFTEMDARIADYGLPLAGRPDVGVATGSVPLTMDLTGLAPIQLYGEEVAEDGTVTRHPTQTWIELHSYNADALAIIAPDPGDDAQVNAPARGDTALTGFTVDWADAAYSDVRAGAPLVEAGDGLTVVQSAETLVTSDRADGWSSFLWRTPVAALQTSAEMIDGQPAAISGALEALEAVDYAVDLRGAAYAALLAPPGPISYSGLSLAIVRDPGTPGPIIGVAPAILSLSASGYQDGGAWIHPGDLAQTFAVADPYTAGQANLSVFAGQYAYYTDPQGGPEVAESWIVDTFPAAAQDGQPAAPMLGPVQQIRIDGREARADAPLSGVGAQPVITFEAPAVGTPDFYVVSLRCLDDIHDGGGTLVARQRTVATWTTTAREVTFPQGILTVGSAYDLQIQAVSGYGLDGYAFTVPASVSMQSTGAFTP